MKHLMRFSGIAVILLVLFTACDKNETNETIIEGVYKGTLTGLQTKSVDGVTETNTATSDITIIGENEIQIHCYSENFDTTFMMNYYMDSDSAYVCFNGDDFEEMYGHMLGNGHMGGMMGDKANSETEWQHHMNDEHQHGDEHFGGFDITNHRFNYTFQMNRNDSLDDLHFQGVKQ